MLITIEFYAFICPKLLGLCFCNCHIIITCNNLEFCYFYVILRNFVIFFFCNFPIFRNSPIFTYECTSILNELSLDSICDRHILYAFKLNHMVEEGLKGIFSLDQCILVPRRQLFLPLPRVILAVIAQQSPMSVLSLQTGAGLTCNHPRLGGIIWIS